MIKEEIRELKTDPRTLRRFGLTVGGVFVCLGLLFLIRGKPWFACALAPGATLAAAGLIAPKLLSWIYLAWMSLAIVLGFLVSRTLLSALFFLVFTPLGWAARLSGKDFLNLKLDREARTYWVTRPLKPKSPAEYDRQF